MRFGGELAGQATTARPAINRRVGRHPAGTKL
jgi:hypothetical protein